MAREQHIVIVGGGTAGITVAATLQRKAADQELAVTIIEPAEVHYYQPAFTLVGAGAYKLSDTARREETLVPPGVEWVKDRVEAFDPDNSRIKLAAGTTLSYDYLVICPGLELNWDQIEGAGQALGKNGVCSNYSPDFATYTWEYIQHLKAGTKALFTQPPLPFKCPGAPQKIVYLAADYLKKHGLLGSCDLHFLTHAGSMFSVPLFAGELDKVAARYGVQVHFHHNLVAVDVGNKTATFEIDKGDKAGQQITLAFDMLHITPPQSPPEVVKASPLANSSGYIELDQHTLQHVRYANVFGLGDAGSTPNSKTAAAVRKQAPVVVDNLLTLLKGRSLEKSYDGYASCPLTTAYGKVLMAEFIYGGKVTPTFPLDPRRERRIYWWIKRTGLPLMYWHYMLKGHEWFFRHNTEYQVPTV